MECVFCGSKRGRSKEHSWPQWLVAFLNVDNVYSGVHLDEHGNRISERKHALNALVLGDVCQVCNNGWMSDLEQAVKPIMTRLLKLSEGQISFYLSQQSCHDLSAWAFKTALVLNAQENYRKIIPREHYTHLYENQYPADGIVIDLGMQQDTAEVRSYQSQGWFFADSVGKGRKALQRLVKGSYKVTLHVGQLVFRVAYLPVDGTRLSPFPDIETRIFPIPSRTVRLSPDMRYPEEWIAHGGPTVHLLKRHPVHP